MQFVRSIDQWAHPVEETRTWLSNRPQRNSIRAGQAAATVVAQSLRRQRTRKRRQVRRCVLHLLPAASAAAAPPWRTSAEVVARTAQRGPAVSVQTCRIDTAPFAVCARRSRAPTDRLSRGNWIPCSEASLVVAVVLIQPCRVSDERCTKAADIAASLRADVYLAYAPCRMPDTVPSGTVCSWSWILDQSDFGCFDHSLQRHVWGKP